MLKSYASTKYKLTHKLTQERLPPTVGHATTINTTERSTPRTNHDGDDDGQKVKKLA